MIWLYISFNAPVTAFEKGFVERTGAAPMNLALGRIFMQIKNPVCVRKFCDLFE